MKKLALLGFLLATGCTHQPPYVPPTEGPLTKIGFVNLSKETPTSILFYEDGLTCKGIRSLAFYSTNYTESSVVVAAHKPFTFAIDHSTYGKYCRQSYMFTPEEGEYRVRTVSGSEECVLVVEKAEIQEDPIWIPVQGLIEREYSTPWFESGEWCAPL